MTLPLASHGSSRLTYLRRLFIRQASRRRVFRTGLVALNVLLVLAVLILVINPSKTDSIAQPVATVNGPQATAAPVDQLASVNIALTVARLANLPEAAAVANQTDSENIELSLSSANNTVIDKPQSVVSSFVSNKDIHTYVSQAGDTVQSVATKFGVTSNSILWSNKLGSNSLSAGKKLFIPPVNGIVYVVRSGDTPATLAAKYHSDQTQIIDDNDAEISGLQAGEQIIIPNGTITPVVFLLRSRRICLGFQRYLRI